MSEVHYRHKKHRRATWRLKPPKYDRDRPIGVGFCPLLNLYLFDGAVLDLEILLGHRNGGISRGQLQREDGPKRF